jgi:hypothetical protein
MQRSRQLFETVDQSGARAAEMIVVNLVDAA